MKVIRLREESEKLNVTVEFVAEAYEKALQEEKIYGIVIPEKDEIIQCKPEEIDALIDTLQTGKMTLKTLEERLNLKSTYVSIVLNYLLREKRIKGILTFESDFISEVTLRKNVLETIKKKGYVAIAEISTELSVSEQVVGKVIEEFEDQIIATVVPYAEVKLVDLSNEAGIPKQALLPLLKRIILNGRISAQLNMVNETLVVNKYKKDLGESSAQSHNEAHKDLFLTSKNEPKPRSSYIIPSNKPSSAWYFAPLLFGLIGGLIGYVAVKNDDEDMAGSLLWLGIGITVLGVILIWAATGWLFGL